MPGRMRRRGARLRRGSAGGAVDGGVERGVVVHLELAVKLEASQPGEGLLPEVVKAVGEVSALLKEDGEAVLVALGVAVGRGGPLGLQAGVEDFEGKDGEAVNYEAGGFGVKRGGGAGQGTGGERVKEGAVELLGEVIAELVVGVNAALDAGQLGVRCAGRAGFVLDVPEVKVGAMLAGDGLEKWVVSRRGRAGLGVPEGGEAVLKLGDGLG